MTVLMSLYLASIAQLVDMSKFLSITYPPYILFSIQEAAFVFSGLAYFTVLLFWYKAIHPPLLLLLLLPPLHNMMIVNLYNRVDFNYKLRSAGPGIKFLQTNTFATLVFLFALSYISACVGFHYYHVETIEQVCLPHFSHSSTSTFNPYSILYTPFILRHIFSISSNLLYYRVGDCHSILYGGTLVCTASSRPCSCTTPTAFTPPWSCSTSHTLTLLTRQKR